MNRKMSVFVAGFAAALFIVAGNTLAMAKQPEIVVADSVLPRLADNAAVKEIVKLEVVDVNEPFELPQLLSGTGGASVKQAIVDPDGGTHELLATFDDPAAAMRSVTSDTGRVLDLLQGSFGLPALDGSSWSRYKWAMYAEFGRDDCPDWYGDGDPQFDKLRAFFDIYENDEENDEILKVASTQGFEAAEPMLPDR